MKTSQGDDWKLDGAWPGIIITCDTGWHECREVDVYLEYSDLKKMIEEMRKAKYNDVPDYPRYPRSFK